MPIEPQTFLDAINSTERLSSSNRIVSILIHAQTYAEIRRWSRDIVDPGYRFESENILADGNMVSLYGYPISVSRAISQSYFILATQGGGSFTFPVEPRVRDRDRDTQGVRNHEIYICSARKPASSLATFGSP